MCAKQSLREKRKRETRRQIQNAARRLIVEGGYDKTTMRVLAREAGVGLGTIGLHFKDKKSLLLSTFHDEIGQVTIRAAETVPAGVPLKAQFMYIIRELYEYYGENALFLRRVVKEALFATGEWKQRFDEQTMSIMTLVAVLIEKAKETGEVREAVDSMHVAGLCWSIYLSCLIDGLSADHIDPGRQVAKAEALVGVMFEGLLR